MTTTNTSPAHGARGSALARERVWDTHWPHFWLATAAFALAPAALLAPLLKLAVSPDAPWSAAFAGPAMVFGVTGMIFLLVRLGYPGAEYFKRTLYDFALFEHGVELRDGQGNILGETANATLRVTSVNVRMGQQMVGGIRLDHRAGSFLLLPRPSVAPWPGMSAVPFVAPYCSVPHATYERVLALAT
ncbi:hypothetical protein SAMN02745121_04984 [Nannocystis exedens]|uniref:Uncharacterized protein n=1 Tax=Nannocystis exedens TaxID=54 RepID=A0A1I2C9E0_9BACT|nr:hypothetical protein [Nannocystis exedens]PCC68446.1 hypothetical protein NAEX_01461 [Nannocystis exedens]SFE64959.1 hypothetical protein SAMN02745121_04984 [Nannocystis exedens]